MYFLLVVYAVFFFSLVSLVVQNCFFKQTNKKPQTAPQKKPTNEQKNPPTKTNKKKKTQPVISGHSVVINYVRDGLMEAT